MLIFAACLVGLAITIASIVVRRWKSSLFDKHIDKIINRKEMFLFNASASDMEIIKLKQRSDYSDVVEDFSMVFGKEIQCSEIKNHIIFHHGFATNNQALSWESAVIMMRLSKIGKIHPGIIERQGLYAIKDSSFYEQPIKFYNIMAENLMSAGVWTKAVLYGTNNMLTVNFIQFTIIDE